uniref:Uncharacterized protein n=1 Tax=Oryza punctata TaxID=4537 RepID=A0A0E0M128_ORYPU
MASASAAVKMAAAVLCVMVALSVAAGQLTTAADATPTCADDHHAVEEYDATPTTLQLGQLQQLEMRLADDQDLAVLLDGGDAGGAATICPSNCQKCLVKCAGTCVADIVSPPTFVACFLKCAVVKLCFAKI